MVWGNLMESYHHWLPDNSWRSAIVWGLPLPDDVLDELDHGPTPRYAQTYRDWNQRLDAIAHEAVSCLETNGIHAHAIPASKTVDYSTMRAEASHRHLAAALGMGWIGKHELLVTKQWGPALRLVTVLLDKSIEPSPPLAMGECGTCNACIDSCPVNALEPPIDGKKLNRCWTLLQKHRANPDIGSSVCGICIKVCRDMISPLLLKGGK
jgi:epoxyqueuosine reductase